MVPLLRSGGPESIEDNDYKAYLGRQLDELGRGDIFDEIGVERSFCARSWTTSWRT
jgi:DNA-directed RNA polymerase subunit N (RpoN/RPB10)